MKKILQLTKVITFALAAIIMFSNTLTAHAVMLLPGMTQTEDGRIKVTDFGFLLGTDDNGRKWYDSVYGYPFCYYTEEYEVDKFWGTITQHNNYLDCYLTDYIKTHDASEWPSFVIKGSDGVPFYYSEYTPNHDNYVDTYGYYNFYYVKYCYDEKSGWWLQDKSYKGPYVDGWGTGRYVETVAIEDLIKETKADIENGKEVNGTAVDPVQPELKDKVIDTDNPPVEDEDDNKPSEPVNPPTDGDNDNNPVTPPTDGGEITDPYADINTLGATVTLSTDCIKVKNNNAAQKPMPKSVKIGKTALKKNKTFTVSYEKYENGWSTVDAITNEGIYRLVITGQNGYDGVYKKRLYVTADKTVKAMSSVSVKVNKMPYTGEPITSGVITTAKSGKLVLKEGTDYTVTYANNINSGTAQVTLTALEGSGFLGTKTVNFSIAGNAMSKVKVNGLGSVTYSPDSTDFTQDMSKVTLAYGASTLRENVDFTVSYTNNTKVGTAKIVFTGIGLYNGTLTKSFKIVKAPLSESMLEDASKKLEMVYTGKAIKPDVTVKNGSTTLVNGTDYTLGYSNNVKLSTDSKPAQIIVKGKGNYTGSFKVNFAIVSDINGSGKTKAANSKAGAETGVDEDETVVDEETGTDDESVAVAESVIDEDDGADDESVAESAIDEDAGTETVTESVIDEDDGADDESVAESVIDGADDECVSEIITEAIADDESVTEAVADDECVSETVTEAAIDEEAVTASIADEESVTEAVTDEEFVIDDVSISEKESISEEVTDEEGITEEDATEEVTEEVTDVK